MIELPLEPPEENYIHEIECPNCGRELHEGDMVFEIRNKGNLEIIACEYCIDELSRFVEDL